MSTRSARFQTGLREGSGMRGIPQSMPSIADPADLRTIMARHGLSRTVTANLLDVPQVTVDGTLAPA
jgi:hypothetical protein